MSRIDDIKAYKQNEELLQADHESKIQPHTKKLINDIQALKPRIDELLETANACLENGIEINAYGSSFYHDMDSYEKGTFVTNSISHRVGFVKYRGINDSANQQMFCELGINAGGACGEYNFRTDGDRVYSKHENKPHLKEPSIADMEHFLWDFEKFETSFYAYVDKVIDNQKLRLDCVIRSCEEECKKQNPKTSGIDKEINR